MKYQTVFSANFLFKDQQGRSWYKIKLACGHEKELLGGFGEKAICPFGCGKEEKEDKTLSLCLIPTKVHPRIRRRWFWR